MINEMAREEIAVAIHNLNSSGGQDRSMREILKHLQKTRKIGIYTYELEKAEEFPDANLHLVRPEFRRIYSLNIVYYLFASLWYFLFPKLFRRAKAPLILTTGAISLVCDIVQVQFVNLAWKKIIHTIDCELCEFPRGRGKGWRAMFFKKYQGIFLAFNSWLETRIYNDKKTYIAISNSVRKELEENFGAKKVFVIPHGVDCGEFRPASSSEEKKSLRGKLQLPVDAVIVIFVGAYERKGLARAIDAIAAMPASERALLHFVAVGAGDTDFFMGRAKQLGIADHVRCVGSRRDIADWYRAADIFLLPSLYEPFGLVVLEAMASALPCVVSSLTGATDLMKNGESGLFIQDPTSSLEIRDALLTLARDAALRRSMGLAARAAAEQRSWKNVAQEYERVLQEALQ